MQELPKYELQAVEAAVVIFVTLPFVSTVMLAGFVVVPAVPTFTKSIVLADGEDSVLSVKLLEKSKPGFCVCKVVAQ